MHANPYNLLTRWLHVGIASSTALSLGLSLVMSTEPPVQGFTWDIVAFNLHKIVGLNAQVLIVLYLVWSAKRHAKSFRELYPWLAWLRRLAPGRSEHRDVVPAWRGSSIFQGLGLLTALTATLSGTMMIMALIEPELLQAGVGLWTTLHFYSGHALWVYLALHCGAALTHVVGRHREILQIFKLLDVAEAGMGRRTSGR